eukprot:gene6250-6318_t
MPIVSAGSPEPLGVTLDEAGVNIAVFSVHASKIEFCLFEDGHETRFALPERTGTIFHGHIAEIRAGARYGLRAHGPYAPQDGHRFNANKLLVDPYALALDGPFILHESMFGYDRSAAEKDLSFSTLDSAPFMPKAIVCAAPACQSSKSFVPWDRTILYEAHVKGLTILREDMTEAQRGTFAGLASLPIRDYLSRLGITTLELLPSSASIDERHLPPLGLRNYWGYNHVAFLVPSPQLAPGGWAEIRAATEGLAESGIETLIDVVYNHSGEGDELGPTVSFRGLDNAAYYRLADNRRFYMDDMGCGNCLALDRPHLVRLVMDSLRAWAEFGGVHGFRFDLAPALGRRPAFDAAAPLIAAIEQDPVLRELKLIAEPWDIGPGGYQLGAFSAAWGEWNDKYRDTMRDFWRGQGTMADFATRLSGSSDIFGAKRPSRSVNFITAHDGFTLADLVSYTRKHNEANGEQNRDGTDQNRSWNNGTEGETDDPAICAARIRDQRNLLATLIFSRGTPMLGMGAEFGQSQGGNNNAYAQDSDLSWAHWAKAERELVEFTRKLLALRRQWSAFFADHFLTGALANEIRDITWLNGQGGPLSEQDWHNLHYPTILVILGQPIGQVGLVFHRGHESTTITLPDSKGKWAVQLSSSPSQMPVSAGNRLELAARSVCLLQDF